MDLVPIKVKIGIRQNGQAKYPDFNSLSIVGGIDWAKYVDINGLGWHYDKTSGHKEVSIDSPFGMQWGCLIVPKAFADEAIAKFPAECTKITEVELEDFYDNKAHAHEPDEQVNESALKVYETIEKAGGVLTTKQKANRKKALDPNDSTPGVKKNLLKRWADTKIEKGINIIQ